jgi:hypothetical protein
MRVIDWSCHIVNHFSLGKIDIEVQDEPTWNADYYSISSDNLKDISNPNEFLKSLLNQLEDPERFVINEDSSIPIVYSRQHEAILSLAKALNQHLGVKVSEDEMNSLRNNFIEMQSERRNLNEHY